MEAKIINKYINIPIGIRGVRYRKITGDKPIIRNYHQFYRDLINVFGWIPAHPNKENIENMHKDLHVMVYDKKDDSSIVRKIRNFFRASEYKNLIIIGDRGVGKTQVCNYYLSVVNKESHDVNIDKKIYSTWFRADIAKLHNINKKIPNSEHKYWTVSDYMVIHAFYVFFQNGQKDQVLSHTINKLNTIDNKISLSDYARVEIVSKLYSNIKEECLRNINMLNSQEMSNEKSSDLYFLFANLYEKIYKTDIKNEDIKHLFKLFVSVIKENYLASAYAITNEIKIVNIVLIYDSVDNLMINNISKDSKLLGGKTNRDWFNDYLEEIKFTLEDKNYLSHDKCIVAIRNDTEKLLFSQDVINHAGEFHQMIYLNKPNIHELFVKRTEYYIKKHTKTVYSSGDSGGKVIPINKIERFKKFYNMFVNAFCSKDYNIVEKSSFVVENLFNNNVRAFLKNLIFSFSYVEEYFNKRNNVGYIEDYENNINVNFISRIIVEASILSGNYFMADNVDNQMIKGRWCPNFFEYLDTTNTKWQGLVIYRVLQLLTSNNEINDYTPYYKNKIIRVIKLLGYDEAVIEYAIYQCFEAGMLKLGDWTLITEDNECKHDYLIDITRKGKHLYDNLIFIDKFYTYIIATGAKLAHHDVDENTSEDENLYSHNINKHPRFFYPSLLRTVTLLLRHIISAHNDDMVILQNSNLSIDELSFYKSIFTTPDISRINNLHVIPSDIYNRVTEINRIKYWYDLVLTDV